MPGPRSIAFTSSGLALLATVVGVGVVAVGNLFAEQTNPGDLVIRQQERLVEMSRQADALAAARDPAQAAGVRRRLQRTTAAFDRAQAALAWGGTATDEDGRPLRVAPLPDGDARRALRRVASLWRQTGTPLAELAAGAYSVHGDAGQRALARLHEDGRKLSHELTLAATGLADWRPPTSWLAVGAGLLAAGLVLVLGRVLGVSRPGCASPPRIGDSGGAPADPALTGAAVAPGPAPVADRPAASIGDSHDDPGETAEKIGSVNPAGKALAGFRSGLIGASTEAATDDGGALLLRNANHAADSTSLVATELEECVHDAARIMERIAQLSRWTQEVAEVIGAECRATNSVDAAEATGTARTVTALAARTSETAAEIEHTISALLCRTREYEEAVGRILGHVSTIHRSARRLGQALESPPRTSADAPSPSAAAPALPVPTPGPVEDSGEPPKFPVFPGPVGDDEPEATVEQVADETAAAIAELVDFAGDTETPDVDVPADTAPPAAADDDESDRRES